MKPGLLTATCPENDLGIIADRAAEIGFESLEVAAWPTEEDTDTTDQIILDPEQAVTNESHAVAVRDAIEERDLTVSALAYYPNNLHPDPEIRRGNHEHLRNVIRTAATMDLDLVGTFIGRDPSLPLDEALADAKEIWPDLLEFAESHDVRLMIENCPMDHYGHLGTNLFYSPGIWEELFEALDSDYLGLNYDPSHLYWLDIDHLAPLERFADRIFQAHAKDTVIFEDRLDELGVLVDRRVTDDHWWEYRLPGLGEIDWGEYISSLYDIGFDGTIALEHEDPRFEKDSDQFWKGAEIGYKSIESYV